jgi:predicted cobalt transporter CbtA
MATFSTIGAGIIVLSMIVVKDFAGTVIFGIFFGVFSGACIALTPAMFGMWTHLPCTCTTDLYRQRKWQITPTKLVHA